MNENATGFFVRLKQRKLVQWALAYIAAAFALIQVIDVVASKFDWPAQLERSIILALAVGFVITLVIAWYHGEKGRQRVFGPELLLLALVLAIGGGAVWFFGRVASVTHNLDSVAGATSPGLRAANATAAAPAVPIPAKSVAVLPFVNMSGDPKNDYFSDGITEEILDALAQVPNLKVAARTSAFAFKGKAEDLRKVGEVLDVATVLEGSIQKSGDEVRITAQLIDTRSGYHLWSEKYDRKLTSIFAVEDEISKAIADKLQVQLAGGSGSTLVAQKTIDPRAHDFYLRGLAEYAARGPSLRDAVTNFRKALALAPDYADAWAALAEANAELPNYGLGDARTSIASAESAARRALTLAPDNAAAHVALGIVYLNRWQWAEADAALRQAMRLAPGDAEAIHQYAYFLLAGGNPDASLKAIDRALERDPLSPVMNAGRSEDLYFLHRYDDAWTQVRSAIAAYPDFALAYYFAIPIASATGHYAELQAYAQRGAEPGNGTPEVVAQLVRGVTDPAQRPAALRILADHRGQSVDPYDAAVWYCLLGDRSGAIEVLDEAMRSGTNPAFSAEAMWSPLFDPVRNDPRFKAMLKKMGLPYVPSVSAQP